MLQQLSPLMMARHLISLMWLERCNLMNMMMMIMKALLTLITCCIFITSFLSLAAGSSTSNSHSSSWSASLADQASQLAEQLQRGNTINKITAARRLQRLASSNSQVCTPARLEDTMLTRSPSIRDTAPSIPCVCQARKVSSIQCRCAFLWLKALSGSLWYLDQH